MTRIAICNFLMLSAFAVTMPLYGDESEIRVTPVTIRLIRDCEVPARDFGVLAEMNVSEGDHAEKGHPLATLESRQQTFAVELAQLNYDAAVDEATNNLSVLAAEEGLNEAERKLKTLEISKSVAKIIAEDKSAVEIAKTDESTSQIQLERAKSAKDRFDSSVSDAELTRLNAQFRKAELSVTDAISKQFTSELQVQIHDAQLAEQRATVSRFRHLAEQERRKLKQVEKTAETRRVELELAKEMLERRKCTSPISGVVTQLHFQPGEFVDAGSPILRIIQLDKLRAEGFVDVRLAAQSLKFRDVRINIMGIGNVTRTFAGKVTFVGQEVDPLNQQVRIWAEFDSPDLDVYPGMSAEMFILPPDSAGGTTAGSQTTVTPTAGSLTGVAEDSLGEAVPEDVTLEPGR